MQKEYDAIPSEEIPQDWIFTFGYGHAHPNKFVRFHGTFIGARKQMLKTYGSAWAFQYPASEEESLKRHFITELKE